MRKEDTLENLPLRERFSEKTVQEILQRVQKLIVALPPEQLYESRGKSRYQPDTLWFTHTETDTGDSISIKIEISREKKQVVSAVLQKTTATPGSMSERRRQYVKILTEEKREPRKIAGISLPGTEHLVNHPYVFNLEDQQESINGRARYDDELWMSDGSPSLRPGNSQDLLNFTNELLANALQMSQAKRGKS